MNMSCKEKEDNAAESKIQSIYEKAGKDGIDLIAFGEINDEKIYLREENREILIQQGYKWFISMAMRISKSVCDLLQFHEDEGLLGYFHNHCLGQADRLDEAAQRIALLIDSWGYGAFVVPGRKKGYKDGIPGVVSHRLLALISGIGTIGDSGLLLTEQYGPRIRLSSILTTMPLPADTVSPKKDYCVHCGKCIDICPSGAINRQIYDPTQPQKDLMDADTCEQHRNARLQRLGTRFCNLCQYICPVGKEDYLAKGTRI